MVEAAPSGENTPDFELGALRERFTVDARDQRSLAWLRTLIAGVAFAAATVLMLSRVPVVIFGVAIVGVLVPFVWLRQARLARRRASNADAYALAIFAQGFVVSDGDTRTVLRFRDVAHIDIDEERLDILVKCTHGPVVRVEPRYPGVAIDELVHKLTAARDDALRSSL